MAEQKLAQMTEDKKRLRELCLGAEGEEGEAVRHNPKSTLEGIFFFSFLFFSFLFLFFFLIDSFPKSLFFFSVSPFSPSFLPPQVSTQQTFYVPNFWRELNPPWW